MRRLCLCFLLLASFRSVVVQAEEQDSTAPAPDVPEADWPEPGWPPPDESSAQGPSAQRPSAQEPSAQGPVHDRPEFADSPLHELFPRFKERAVVLDINARIIDQNQTVTWNETHRKATMPGRSVGIKLVGTNVVVAVQFTPYLRRRGSQKLLVAQGQVWIDIPNQGMRCQTSMQTIPLEFGEPIYFFPLGPLQEDDTACIEVMLTLHPYEDEEQENHN